jgi:hypothetical protein
MSEARAGTPHPGPLSRAERERVAAGKAARAGSRGRIRIMPSLNFKGKALVQNFHLLVPFHELKPVKAKCLTEKVSLHDNFVVHGDNLKALKSLLPLYHGKVKCIYIDPPYSTGNESWVCST